MATIDKVKEQRVETQKAIAEKRLELQALEEKEKRLVITETTLAEIEGIEAPAPVAGAATSVRQAVLSLFRPGEELTKGDVLGRLGQKGVVLNEATVGSTLSKAVGSDLEKAGANSYRLKR